jgi:hypothetical protein
MCVLMPSTSSAYPHVISRTFASFQGLKYSVWPAQIHIRAWFDSRQLHNLTNMNSEALALKPSDANWARSVRVLTF